MSGGCCSPLGPGTTPVSAFRIADAGTLLPTEPALNIINGDLTDNPGVASDLTLHYQFVENSDGPFPQRAATWYSDKFALTDNPGFDSTDVDLAGELLPAVGVNDAQDVLAVNPAGAWATAANGFLHFTTAALRNAYPGLRTEGMLAYVSTTQCLYMLAPDLTTWMFFAPSPALQAQAAWAIDAGTGSDNNSGAPGSPLASTEELGRRVCPRGGTWTLSGSVAITIAAGSYGALELNYAPQEPLTGLTFSIACAFTSVAATLTSVVNTTAGTQGRITIAAGPTFTARQRIRSTSGANIGAITYGVGGLNSTTDTFVKTWLANVVVPAGAVNIANGTTVALDTLGVTIARCILRPITHASAQLTTTISDAILPNGISILQMQGSSNAAALGCLITGGRSQGNFRFVNCKFTGTPQLTDLLNGDSGAPVLVGCCFSQATLLVATTVFCNLANCFDASAVQVGGRAATLSINAGTLQEWSNGAGLTAITIGGAAISTLMSGVGVFYGGGSGGQIIGFGTAYAVGYALESGTSVVTVSMAAMQINSTVNVQMSGNARTYAQLPGDYQRANCFFSVTQDTTAAFNNT